MENFNAEQIRYKMSEKQIKTALECLSKPNSSPADREKCYFMWKEPSCFSCYHEVAQNALALIISQEQRIKELTKDKEWSAKRIIEADKRVAELTEENERLRAEKEAKNKELFYKWKKIADETADRYEGLYQDAKKALVADTVREMQERVKAEMECWMFDFEYYSERIKAFDRIDQIAKELEGEK